MIQSFWASTIEKSPEPPQPSINGATFHAIDHRTIPVYGSVDLGELASILGTSAEAIEEDAANFDLSVDQLVQQVTRLKPISYPGEEPRYMRSPV